MPRRLHADCHFLLYPLHILLDFSWFTGPYYTAGNTGGTAHLKPGGLSGERRNPAFSFGARLPGEQL